MPPFWRRGSRSLKEDKGKMEDKEKGLSKRIAQFIVESKPSDIPPYIYEHAKVAFLDWFAVLLAGKDEPLVLKLIHYTDLMGGNPQATILGHGLKRNVDHAALINGTMSHALDYDDSMSNFLGHPSVTLFPALVALSEWKQMSGKDFLTAYIIGLKVGATIGACAGYEHYMAGWHGTSTIGRMASAAGCAKLLGLDEQKTVYALGIAGTQAAGLKRVFGTMCKPYHAGKASQVGLESVLLASDDFTSAENILEGADGFFHILKGQENEEAIASLGKTWETNNLAQKYHASCHGTHSAIEAVLGIVKREGLTIDDIKSITVYTSQMAVNIAAKMEPKTGLEGKFSIYYCVANALLRGYTGMQAFTDEKVNDPEIKDFMKKISVVVDSDILGLPARVQVETVSNEVFEESSDVLNEIPEFEIKKEKVQGKFMDLCVPILSEKKSKQLMETFLSFDKMDNMRDVIEEIHGSTTTKVGRGVGSKTA